MIRNCPGIQDIVMNSFCFALICFFLLPAAVFAESYIQAVYTVKGELDQAKGHMQGMAVSPDAIYVSHKEGIFKLDRNGKLLKHVNTPSHTGDICYNDGKIYSAVVYYDKARSGRGSVRIYDDELNELDKYELDQPSDAITVLGDYIYFGIGPIPHKPHRVNYIARIKKDFSGKLETFEIDYGTFTHFGAQTMCTDGKYIYMCFYRAGGKGMPMAVFTPDLKVVNTVMFYGSIGFDTVQLPEYPDVTTFIKTSAAYDIKQKEQPLLKFEFFKYSNGKMISITKKENKKRISAKN